MSPATAHYLTTTLPLAAVLILTAWGLGKTCTEASNSAIIRTMLAEIIRRHKLECAGCTALVLVAVRMMLAI